MLRYVDHTTMECGKHGWLPIVTWDEKNETGAPIRISQDVNIYAIAIKAGKTERFTVADGRQAYMVLIEGEAEVNGVVSMAARDALAVTEEEIEIKAGKDADIVLTEMSACVNGRGYMV